MMNKKLEFQLNVGDWISIPHVVELEIYLQIDESNMEYYKERIRKKEFSCPRKVEELEVRNYYEEKIKEHRKELSAQKMIVEIYKYKLGDLK